jgi:hypothetical protein
VSEEGKALEYREIRADIRSYDLVAIQLLALTVATSGVVLTAAASSDQNWTRFWLYQLIPATTLAFNLIAYSNRSRIWRAATYQLVFLEGDLGVAWESRLEIEAQYAKGFDRTGKILASRSGFVLGGPALFIALNLIATVASVLHGLKGISEPWWQKALLGAVAVANLGVSTGIAVVIHRVSKRGAADGLKEHWRSHWKSVESATIPQSSAGSSTPPVT